MQGGFRKFGGGRKIVSLIWNWFFMKEQLDIKYEKYEKKEKEKLIITLDFSIKIQNNGHLRFRTGIKYKTIYGRLLWHVCVWDGLTEVGEMIRMHWDISETAVKFLPRVVVLISKPQNDLVVAQIWKSRKTKCYAPFHLSLEFLHS